MDCEALIDFNSPLKENGNLLVPLVPLPKYQSDNIQSNAEVVATGDNPFDNVILQLCKHDDPFEITEKQAQQPKKKNNALSHKQDVKERSASKSGELGEKIDNEKSTRHLNESCTAQLKSNSTVYNTSTNSCSAVDIDQPLSPCGKSMSESCLSSTIEKIENKFSNLYLSTQFDKQILDESSKCIDVGTQDISLEGCTLRNVSQKSEDSFNTLDIPTRKEDVKAFVAGRIEKCIEKALNSSRCSLNTSLRHRRSLSAASLYTDTITSTLYPDNRFSCTKQTSDLWGNSFKRINRSFSNHDLHTSFNTRMWGSQHNIAAACSGESSLNAINRWNTTTCRKSSATSVYSSYGPFDTGFRKSSTSSYRPSGSSNPNHSVLSQIGGDDSVFVNNDTVIMEGKKSSCVFMEAKNLSFILQRRARSADDEPMEADVNFLTDDNFRVDLVDSDSSISEGIDEESSSQKLKRKKNSCGLDSKSGMKMKTSQTAKSNNFNVQQSQCSSEAPLPLSRDKVDGMGLHTQSLRSKKSRSPLLVPSPPVPLSSNSDHKNVVMKHKLLSNSRVVTRGPMKAMIPVGNMMRHDTKKESNVLPKRSVGHQQKGVIKLIPSNSSMRRSVSTGDLVLHKNSNHRAVPSKERSPASSPCGRPIACSTPAPNDILPLVSPPVGLQMSRISSSTPVNMPVDSGHRRSKSTGHTVPKKTERESQLISTPTRKVPRCIRPESGLVKNKQLSPKIVSPGPSAAYTSTPLKSLTKNSPSFNRIKKPSLVNRKLLQKEGARQMEKENLQPRA